MRGKARKMVLTRPLFIMEYIQKYHASIISNISNKNHGSTIMHVKNQKQSFIISIQELYRYGIGITVVNAPQNMTHVSNNVQRNYGPHVQITLKCHIITMVHLLWL